MGDRKKETEETEGTEKRGIWDADTARYIPMGGGSISRLPPEENKIRPYSGFLGVNPSVARKNPTVGDLFRKLGGGAKMSRQDEAFVAAELKKSDD